MIRFWYSICLLFLLFNINILIEESYQVVYKMVNQSKPIECLICLNLNEIIINKTRIKVNEIKNESIYNLRWIQINKKDKYGKLISNKKKDKILGIIQLNDYLIYQDRICFIFSHNQNHLSLFSNLLDKLRMNKTYFSFNNDTFSFLKSKDFFFEFNQITIQHKAYPYSHCSKDYSNFKCLNDKIKKKQKLSKYYYRSDDNGSIELNYHINQTIIDNEIKTIKQCNQIDCKINLLFPNQAIINSESITLKSFLYISEFDFYFQLIGLIVLFLNISIYQLIIQIANNLRLVKIKFFKFEFINLIKSKLKFKKLKYLKLNYLILLITLICLSILFNRSISNFIIERDYPPMKSISANLIRSELSIVICVDIYRIKGDNYDIYNRSLLELENDTDNGLNIVLKDIYMEFLNKKIPTKWQLESKLILFHLKKRCFQLRIFLDEPKYRSIFSITELIIEFNERSSGDIYILTDNEMFNSETFRYNPYYNFKKRILERSKLNKIKKCKDYNQVDDNCNSKWNCIDRCINRNIYNQFKYLSLFYSSFINKQYFQDEEWANLFIKPNFNFSNLKIVRECVDKYSKLEPCIDIKFERQSEIIYKSGNKIEINLNYDVIYYKEDEPSIFKLLLDLLNIEINLFGLNFYNCSFMILSLLKLDLKLIKIFKLLIYLICSIGFTIHLWSIYNEIINIEIIYSKHYELINKIKMPDLIFCFDINQTKIDPNYKLTYEYLDKITEELSENNIFNRIEYLNSSNKWIKLDNKTNFQDNNLEIRIFYYLNRKCFKIILNIEYDKNQFEFNEKMNDDDGLVIKILFNRTCLIDKLFYFFTKNKKKFQFSKINRLNFTDGSNYIIYKTIKSFKIKHQIIKRDKFELIKNPLSSNEDQNDLDKFFTKFMNYFETKLNFVTFKLPFEKTSSNLKKEINDNLFIQLYNQQQNNSNLNHFRQHSYNYLEYNMNPIPYSLADFRFGLSFYRKVIVVSNKISLIKLIINLLNVLSFWFELGILDLYDYLFKIKSLIIYLYKFLTVYLFKFLIKIKLLIIFKEK